MRRAALPIVVAPAAPDVFAPTGRPARSDLRDLSEADLEPLLVAFYADLAGDPMLAPYFAPVDLAGHVPRVADFWATVLFHAGRYAGNAFRPHQALDGLTAAHFARWVAALERAVDARHAGAGAERMKAAGRRIAGSMQARLGIAARDPGGALTR